ncbi:MAG TPA: hypothetical protein ENK91_07430 [Bacteroidetes bacterium]|nr:hypothetical protein [Bacteroidota bacterium]
MNDKNIDKYTKELIKEIGLDSPSPNFVGTLMRNISLKKEEKFIYKPLISIQAWIIIAIILISTIIILYFFPIINHYYFTNGFTQFNLLIKNIFQSTLLYKLILYTLGFLIIFLLQISIIRSRLLK